MHTLTSTFRRFAHEHDDVPAFHAVYLVVTFLAAAMLSLGFFAILIAMHMCLDYVKYREVFRYGIRMTFKAMILESIVDIALFMLSLVFAVYLSETLLLPAASGLLRSGLTIAKAIGTILPKFRILEHIIVILVDIHVYLYTPRSDLRLPLARAHSTALTTVGISTVLLLLAAFFFRGHEADLLIILTNDLVLHV